MWNFIKKSFSAFAFFVLVLYSSDVLGQNCIQKKVVVLGNKVMSRDQAEIVANLRSRVASNPCIGLIDVDDYLEAGVSPGARQIEVGEEFLAVGQSRFLDGQTAAACPILAKAVTALLEAYAYLVYPGSLVDALMFYGTCSSMLSKVQEAKKAFAMALRLRPSVDIKDYSVSSEAIAPFEEVKQSQNRGKGVIEVYSTPEFADVYVDGERRGVTPLKGLEIEDGYHFVVIKKLGYIRASTVVSVVPFQTTKVDLSLTPAKRKPLLDVALKKVSSGAPIAQISEDLKALFLADMALIVDFKDKGDIGSVLLINLGMGALVGKSESTLSFDLETHLDKMMVATDINPLEQQRPGPKHPKLYERWWFWTVVGAACASGALSLSLLLPREGLPAKVPQEGKGAVLIRF